MQARRRREARAQLAFDELIATVRAEDPQLAAEEARAAARTVDTHCGHACYGFTRCGYTALPVGIPTVATPTVAIHSLWLHSPRAHFPLWLPSLYGRRASSASSCDTSAGGAAGW